MALEEYHRKEVKPGCSMDELKDSRKYGFAGTTETRKGKTNHLERYPFPPTERKQARTMPHAHTWVTYDEAVKAYARRTDITMLSDLSDPGGLLLP
jgi:hypothetical protein